MERTVSFVSFCINKLASASPHILKLAHPQKQFSKQKRSMANGALCRCLAALFNNKVHYSTMGSKSRPLKNSRRFFWPLRRVLAQHTPCIIHQAPPVRLSLFHSCRGISSMRCNEETKKKSSLCIKWVDHRIWNSFLSSTISCQSVLIRSSRKYSLQASMDCLVICMESNGEPWL